LQIEDHLLQSMPDASPLRWHLAHVTWFFETFLLVPFSSSYRVREPRYRMLFNSYYNGVGAQWPRDRRHLLSRPTVAEILNWRTEVDAAVIRLLESPTADQLRVLEVGLNHEQQHQELMVTDLKHGLLQNPLCPAYDATLCQEKAAALLSAFVGFEGGVVAVGPAGDGFNCRAIWSPMRTSRPLSKTMGIGARICGSQTGGHRSPRRDGARRCTGERTGRWARWGDNGRSTRTRR